MTALAHLSRKRDTMAAVDPPPTPAANEQVMLVVRLDTRPGAEAQMSEALAQLADATRQHDRGVVRFEIGLDPDRRHPRRRL